jgi:hypothetical protein
MKRDRYASDYEQVRRQAGLGRPQMEFPDDPAPVNLGRIDAAHDDFKQRMAALAEHDAAAAAERKRKADDLTKRANGTVALAEYRAAGVESPSVDGDGAPRVSLSLLLSIGWTVEDVDGARELVAPRAKSTKRQRRDDYDRST